jgi:hypothetical protein
MTQNTALNILKSGENCFLTGSAGTGKTYLLNQYISYLTERKINPVVTAPTGIAASHLNGQTIHSYFAIGIRDSIDNSFLKSLSAKKHIVKRFEALRVLIIDEISMVSPELFAMIDEILRAFKEPFAPFGGVQVIVCGDFFQLPPVSREPKEKRFAWQANVWRELNFSSCYLDTKFRQDDDRLITLLDDIRKGSISKESYELIDERILANMELDYNPTKLYTHNIDVDRVNTQELEKLEGKEYTFEHTAKGVQRAVDKIFSMSLVNEELTLKKDAVVIFIKNNPEGKYINGTTGIVTGFEKGSGLPFVKTANEEHFKVEAEEWTLEDDQGKKVATVEQLPLRLAWAITVHKSQGMTLDAAQIDLSKTFEMGQGYVALSRVKNSSGLKLLGINKMALSVDPLTIKVDAKIKQASLKASQELETLENIEKIHRSHIRDLGGTNNENEIARVRTNINAKKRADVESKIPTHIKTKKLLDEAKNLKDLAKLRGSTKGTIITHLDKIINEDKTVDLEKFMPNKKLYNLVVKTFKKLKEENSETLYTDEGKIKRKVIFDTLGGDVSYDDIQLVLLFMKK